MFYDYVGKFCNSEAKKILEKSKKSLKYSILSDEGENVIDQSMENINFPEERKKSDHSPNKRIQDIKTSQF
jgi:hypothetical protein